MSNPANDIQFTGIIRNPRRHTDGIIAAVVHPELTLDVVFPHNTDPHLTRNGAKVTVTGDGDTEILHARTVTAAQQ